MNKAKWFVRGDIDGFFGLFIDNLLQLMLISVLCRQFCGFDDHLINAFILPGAAISILIDNLFYAWQAKRLAGKTGRDDITALPYGINTPSVFAYIFFIMKPVYDQTNDANLAWQAGLFACFLSGVMEFLGSFVANWLRQHTPRAALLSALAGIAITFIAMGFIFQLFAYPTITVVPMMIILIAYAGRIRLPLGLPGGLVAVVVGAAIAWILIAINQYSPGSVGAIWQPPQVEINPSLMVPKLVVTDVFALVNSKLGWGFMSVIFPMGLFNIIGSLQNLESAEAAGDTFPTRSSMVVNGIGSMAAALFGSAFPTTIYIGHPGWKAMGARCGYSLVNGIVITIMCLTCGLTIVQRFIPLEAMLPILLWIGIIITAQAYQTVPHKHALAVSLGLIPAIAAWAFDFLIQPFVVIAGKTLPQIADQLIPVGGVYLSGMIALRQGSLLSAMIYAAILVFVIERQFLKAAGWAAAAAVCSMLGLIHAYQLTDYAVLSKFGLFASPAFAIAYWITAAILLWLHLSGRSESQSLTCEIKSEN